MSATHCDNCKRPFTPKRQPQFSSQTGRRYCPVTDENCQVIRRRLIKSGAIDLDAENREVREAMKRRQTRDATK